MNNNLKQLTVWTGAGWREVEGTFIKLAIAPEIQVFIHETLPDELVRKDDNIKYHITEYTTGACIGYGKTKKEAERYAVKRIKGNGLDIVNDMINKYKRREKYKNE